MEIKLVLGLVLLCIGTCSCSLNVSQCHDIGENPIANLTERVKVGTCKKPPCRLRKNTFIKVELKLKPEKDVEKLTNNIVAYIVGVPFPFPGVDGTDACDFMFTPDGKTKVPCPLKAGEEYLYRNNVEVLQIYPRIKTVVHWGLVGSDGYLTCFEVPARITN